MNTKQKVLKELRTQPRRAAAAGRWEPRVTWSCLYYPMGCPCCRVPGVFTPTGGVTPWVLSNASRFWWVFFVLELLFGTFFFLFGTFWMIEMEIVQNRELLQSVGRVTSATCADLNRDNPAGCQKKITQEPESSRSQQTRASPRAPLLSCCPLIPPCRCFCGL